MTLSQKSQIISGTASSSGIKTPLKGLIPRLTERVIIGSRVLRLNPQDVAASVQAQDRTVTEQGVKVAEHGPIMKDSVKNLIATLFPHVLWRDEG